MLHSQAPADSLTHTHTHDIYLFHFLFAGVIDVVAGITSYSCIYYYYIHFHVSESGTETTNTFHIHFFATHNSAGKQFISIMR